MSEYIFFTLVFVAVALNFYVSFFLLRRDDLDSFQKGAQILIIWLIPYFASVGLWLLCKSNDAEKKGRHKEFGGGWNNSGGPGSPDGGM